VVLSAALLRYAFDAESGYEERGFDLFCISLMAAVGLIVKLNFLVLGLGALVAALVIWFSKHGRGDKLKDSSPLVWVTLGVAIIWLPWMVQGVITSGYPFCPLSFGAFQVDWRIPQENLTEHMDWIRSWARAPGMEPGKVLTNWDWLKPWFGEMLKTDEGRLNLVTPAVLTFIFAGLGLYGRLTAKDKINIPALSWLFLLYPLASILFWFVTAPDPRYVGAGFWILAAGAGALAIAGFEDRPNPLMTPLLALCLALALSIIFLDKPLKPSKKRQTTFNVPPPG
jgi:hypothetical protein